jgi:hypothetical protein
MNASSAWALATVRERYIGNAELGYGGTLLCTYSKLLPDHRTSSSLKLHVA